MDVSPAYLHNAHPACLASLSLNLATDSHVKWAVISLAPHALQQDALYAQQATI